MLVINKEVIKEDKYKQGGVLICYLKIDYEHVREQILNPLENYGYRIYTLELTPEVCLGSHYLLDTLEKIEYVSCGIFVLSQMYDDGNYLACRQTFYYEIGMMESKKKNVYPFLLNIKPEERKRILLDKPIAMTQGTSQIDEIIKEIEKLNVPKEIYFKNDPHLNKQVIKRIKRTKITATMNIYRDTLKSIWEDGWKGNSSNFDDNSVRIMIEELYKSLRVGAIILRFGKNETITQTAFSPYLLESEWIYYNSPAQYDKTIAPKPIEYLKDDLINDKALSEIATTIRLEFIIPVHDILGTSFKPYISISRKNGWNSILLKIVQRDALISSSNAETIKNESEGNENRIYFLLPTCIIDPGINKYGTNCNYIYPK